LATDVFLHVYRAYPEVPSPIYPQTDEGMRMSEPNMLLAAEAPTPEG
jgi:hypothetical protein